ncbi:MAG: eukaryotic-like serine/threonine-protein kinase [Microbacteriaceae bacterium]|nr:pknB [Microbacteriaceae bacterium]MDQ1525666.1 eukaryotic-like serine/threonine-protein kinase [Microbacteriaceae bacterium]MDQ1579007.1 eukaryotic-like serine/threonine-protein kinase [Microbacteriaceae bacterium]
MTEGTRLLAGRYQVGELIGRGGMSDVHLGVDSRLGRRVAIKLLRPSLATDPRFRILFREEAQKAARMAHPTIVRVFDAGEETVREANGFETQVPFIVMEYVDGRLLRDIIADGPLEPRQAVRIISGVLTALEYSHRALLVHRDIKPGNIMVTPSGQVKVMDFGIARAVSDSSATVADTSAVLGTAQYFSPEQARGETVDARTDLYSTGVVLFELLTGRPPFRGERAAAVAYQHISETAVAPSSLNPRVSPALDAVVLHALAKDKFERFQTAAEFRDDLETAAAGAIPVRKPPASDFNTTLFGVNPSAVAGSEAALRQLSSRDDERLVRTQTRPPVAWIWAGIVSVIVILFAVVFWVVNLPTGTELSKGLSTQVPNVVGELYKTGASKLQKINLVPTQQTETSTTVPEGTIIRTDPKAGLKVGAGQVVTLWVSLGKSQVTVPSMTNQTEDAAKQAIKDAGLVYGSTTTEHSPNIPAGIVIRSSPAANTPKSQGDTVDLVVSDGLVTIPSISGQTSTDGIKALVAMQLNVDAVGDPSCTGGKVTGQSLTGDQPQKSNVTVTYCSG